MNQIFSFRRFQLMLKLDASEKGKGYLMMAGLMTAVLLMLMLPMVMSNEHSNIHMFLHGLALFMVVSFGGTLYTNQAFSQYGNSATGISAIMIPASRLEKFLSALLLNAIFTAPLMYGFLKLHYGLVQHANASFPAGTNRYQPIPEELMSYFLYLYIIAQGVVFLGSIYFKKLSYIKTAIVLFLSYMFVAIVNFKQASYLTGHPAKLVTFPYSSWKIWYHSPEKFYRIQFPAEFQSMVYAFPVFILLAMWFIAYIRLKEKQI